MEIKKPFNIKETARKHKKLLIGLILALSILIPSVSAAAYVVLQWTTTATVVSNPKTCFIKWADGTKANTFDYAVNIFPSIRTVDENITYGIQDWDAGSQTIYMRIYSITNSANLANVTTVVKTGAGATKITVTWTGGALPTTYQSFSAGAAANYTIWTELLAAGSPSGSSVITYDMKVENP